MKFRDPTVHHQMQEFISKARMSVAADRAIIIIRAHDESEPFKGEGCLVLYDRRDGVSGTPAEIADLLVDLLHAASSVTDHIGAKIFVEYGKGEKYEVRNEDSGMVELTQLAIQAQQDEEEDQP